MANLNIDYLVVGAGGGGGSANGASGSGGGAGEYLYQTGQTILTGIAYTVDVGINGVGGATAGNGQNGTSGVDSSFNNYIARGGGFGVVPNLPGNGGDGGSGGGANYPTNSPGSSTAVSPGLGNSGGAGSTVGGGAGAYGSGGGGGAAQAGFPGTTSVAGNGGDGIYNSITGTSTAYAAGGGGGIFAPSGQYTFGIGGSGGTGGSSSITNNASDGAPSTGSGGGGGSYSTSTVPYNGGNGSQGIVILRWLTTDAGYTVSGANPTETIDGAYTVLSFTAVVTSTITFNSTPKTKISSALVDFNSGTEDGLKLPSGDDANQPTGVQGMIRNNTNSGMSSYNGSEWISLKATESPVPPPSESPYNNVLYTGSGDTTNGQSITGIGFQPDLLWFKSTGTTYYNVLYDSIRGTNAAISSNLTNSTYSNYNRLQSFDNDGFTIKANNTADLWKIDRSGQPFVAWCFKAGGAAVANTDGNIASQVSANVAGGFSIVSYIGNSSFGQTVGHGLNAQPQMVIYKNLDNPRNWRTYVEPIGATKYLNLDENTGEGTYGSFDNTSPTSTVFSTTNSVADRATNYNGDDFIAYCFHSVTGFSKIGSYTGTGANMTVDVGFEPAFVMIKNTSSSASWHIFDNKRTTANPSTEALFPNESLAAADYNTVFVFTSTGFNNKVTSTSLNNNGSNYIYLAFA